MDLIAIVLQKLNDSGFSGIKPVSRNGQVFSVTDIRGISRYQIVTLDAISNQDFHSQIYVAVENNTNSLLEIAKVSSSPRIIGDGEALEIIASLFPGSSFEIVPGYFWEPCIELTSRLSVARKFSVNGKQKFLLPDGLAVDQLSHNHA